MEYLGLKTDKSLVNREDAEKLFDKIRGRVKAHRRKIHENLLPNLEEMAFMNSSWNLVNGNIQASGSNSAPNIYLGEGTYKIVVTAKSIAKIKNPKLTVNLNRNTSPSFQNKRMIEQPLTSDFQTFEADFVVDKLGTYRVIVVAGTSNIIEVSEFFVRRVYT